jgi:hypothetical protein
VDTKIKSLLDEAVATESELLGLDPADLKKEVESMLMIRAASRIVTKIERVTAAESSA